MAFDTTIDKKYIAEVAGIIAIILIVGTYLMWRIQYSHITNNQQKTFEELLTSPNPKSILAPDLQKKFLDTLSSPQKISSPTPSTPEESYRSLSKLSTEDETKFLQLLQIKK